MNLFIGPFRAHGSSPEHRPIHDAHAAFAETARDLEHPEATANL